MNDPGFRGLSDKAYCAWCGCPADCCKCPSGGVRDEQGQEPVVVEAANKLRGEPLSARNLR